MASSNPPARQSVSPLRILVGVRGDGFNGIDTYAEQLAAAGVAAGHHVTLVTTTRKVAEAVRARQGGKLNVIDAGLGEQTPRELMSERVLPQLQNFRLGRALARTLQLQPQFDVVHLNRPALSRWVPSGHGSRVFVTGWFYPHAPGPRLLETWRHAPGRLPRRLALTLKSLAFYMGDANGFRKPAHVVACTHTLAEQLRSQGLQAVACPPPVQDIPSTSGAEPATAASDELRLLICSGDLSHPRKNLIDAVRAAGVLAKTHRRVVLRAIGRKAEAPHFEARNLPPNARLELLGPKSPEEVRAEMRRAHAFLLPSLYEEWGYVAVESILSGTPVVTYPVYPFKDMLEGGLGVVAERVAPDALARAVEQSLSGMRGRPLSEAGQKRFGTAAIGERLTRIWAGIEATP